MNKMTIHPSLKKNIRLYGWFKIFNKRVFIPVTAVYLVDVGDVTLFQLGAVATLTGLVTLAAQIPTGHFADYHSRRSAMMIGAAILAVGTAVLAWLPSFEGALLAGLLTGMGFSFISGSGQALMHDSLDRWGDTKQYVKVMGRAQSRGLIGNIVLVGLIPMTYALNPRLPFVLGTLAFLVLLSIAYAFIEPEREARTSSDGHFQQIIKGVRTFVHADTILLFIAIGFVSGLYAAPTDYSNLVLKDLGIAPEYIGWVFSASSLIGAIGGYGLHYLQKFSFKTFAYIDIAVCCLLFIIIGLTQNMWIAAIVVLLNLSFWRLRNILLQHYLLELFGNTSRKAVLMSLTGLGEQLFVIILPLGIAAIITHYGYYNGYTILGLVTGVILCVLMAISFKRLARKIPTQG